MPKRILTQDELKLFLDYFKVNKGQKGIDFRKKYKISLKADGNWYTCIKTPLNITER